MMWQLLHSPAGRLVRGIYGSACGIPLASGTPVTNFKRSNKPYRENASRDRDKDGIACEKK